MFDKGFYLRCFLIIGIAYKKEWRQSRLPNILQLPPPPVRTARTTVRTGTVTVHTVTIKVWTVRVKVYTVGVTVWTVGVKVYTVGVKVWTVGVKVYEESIVYTINCVKVYFI